MIFATVLIILSLDQLTKFFISKNLLLEQSIPVISGMFHLTLVHNRGAAFGILKNQVPLFILTSILAIILIYFSLKKNGDGSIFWKKNRVRKNRTVPISLMLILAGAVGNLIDRVRFGYVIDFLDFRIWPVFNLADSAITIGAISLGWSLLQKKPETRAQKTE